MEPKNEGIVEVEESLDLPEIPEGQADTTDWKDVAQKLREKAITQRERTKTLKKDAADAKAEAAQARADLAKGGSARQPTPGELDETQLDYLDLKGVSESEDIKIIEDVMKKTGMTVRDALKDEYVVTKLTANKTSREVKAAIPSSTKRSGAGQSNDLALAIAKYEQSGYKDLPDDFALATQVVNTISNRTNTNKPSWHSK